MSTSNVNDVLAAAEAAAANMTPASAPTSQVTDMVPSQGGGYAVAVQQPANPASMQSFMQSGLAPDAFIQPDKAKFIAIGKKGMFKELIVGIDLSETGNCKWVWQTSYGNPIQYFSASDRNGVCIENGKLWQDIVTEGYAISKALGKTYRGDFQTCKLYMTLLEDSEDIPKNEKAAKGLTLGYTPTVTTAKNLAALITGISKFGTGKLKVKLTSEYAKNNFGEWGALQYEVLGAWDGQV